MKIILSPQRRDDKLVVSKSFDSLIINNEIFNFTQLGEGDTLPMPAIKSEWFADDVTRVNGELIITLILPNPVNYSPEQAFPIPLEDVREGLVEFPKPLEVGNE